RRPTPAGGSRAPRAGRGRAQAEGAAVTRGTKAAAYARPSHGEDGVYGGRGGGCLVRGGRRRAGGAGVAAAPGGEESARAGDRAGAGSAAGPRLEDTRPRRESPPRYCRSDDRERQGADPERPPASETRPRTHPPAAAAADGASDATHCRPAEPPFPGA